HVLRAPGRRLHLLAPARERDELVDDGPDAAHVVPEGAQRGRDPPMLRDVIGPEDIDDRIVAARELVEMVRDVGQAIGRLAGALDDDTVLLEADCLAREPDRPFAPHDEPALLERLDRRADRPRTVERVLVEIAVEDDPEPLLRGPDGREDRPLGGVAERVETASVEPIAVRLDQLAGDVADVLALV